MNMCINKNEYLRQIIDPARRVCKRYGYLPSVLIAQSCLENGFGMAEDCRALVTANNLVGIKKDLLNKSWVDIGLSVWPGESISKITPEEYDGKTVKIRDSFRVYDCPEQSFTDFLLFLTYASNDGPGGRPKYGGEVLALKDPESLIRAISVRGYATDSGYVSKVMKIIRQQNLTQYDNLTEAEPTQFIPEALTKTMSNHKIEDRTAINQKEASLAYARTEKICFIVVHYLGVPNADNPDLYNRGYGGNFYVARNGNIYMAADPKKVAVKHCGGGLQGAGGHSFYGICTNANSIGIECGVCYTDSGEKSPSAESDKWYFTKETQESLVWLVKRLMKEYGISADHVIRHYDVTGKICPNPYVKNNRLKTSWTWNEFKSKISDPCKDVAYRVQCGKYTNKATAIVSRDEIKTAGFHAIVLEGKKKYIVQCGLFENKQNAINLKKKLRLAGFPVKVKEVSAV